MTNYEIKEIALSCGFSLKRQPDGNMDLNPYVYAFARAMLVAAFDSPEIHPCMKEEKSDEL